MDETTMIDGGDFLLLSQISSRDKSWDGHKGNSRQVSEIYGRAEYENYSKRIWECSQSLEFRVLTGDDGVGHLKLHSARFCRVRFCPICQWRRSMMWRARFLKALPKICEDHPRGRFIFLTLTIRNCDLKDLRSTLAGMNEAWKKVIKRKNFPATGWAKSVEVTRGRDGTAHPHFHILLMVNQTYFSDGYISKANWAKMWGECLKVNYTPVVDVRTVKDRKKKVTTESIKNVDVSVDTVVDNPKPKLNNDIIAGVLETIKYSVKPSDLIGDNDNNISPEDWLAELTRQLHKTRSIALGGIFKEYLSEDEPEDLINADLEDETDLEDEDYNLIFEWGELMRKYAYKYSVDKSSTNQLTSVDD
jgi:plasmid rolling circle replication initiator protein Rep